MKTRVLASFLFLTTLAFGRAYGQEAAIVGSVHDLDGKPISRAVVYAYNTAHATGRFVRLSTLTGSDGGFRIKNLSPGSYRVHAYKESDGYPDTFYAFFTANRNAWKSVEVYANRMARVDLELGPKGAKLNISIRDDAGNMVAGSVSFQKLTDRQPSYSESVDPDSQIIVPPIQFRVKVTAPNYSTFESELLKPKSGERLKLNIRLTRSQ